MREGIPLQCAMLISVVFQTRVLNFTVLVKRSILFVLQYGKVGVNGTNKQDSTLLS